MFKTYYDCWAFARLGLIERTANHLQLLYDADEDDD